MAVLIKRSAVAGKVPTTSSMNLGELAMNTNDGRLFMMANNGSGNQIVEITSATSLITVPVTATAMTLTGLQYSNAMIVFTGALTGNTVITVPNTAHSFIVVNRTTGNYSLTMSSVGMSPSTSIVQGAAESLLCDTTGVYATASTTGVEFAKMIAVTTSQSPTITSAGALMVVTTPGITITLPLAASFPSGAGIGVLNVSGGNITVALTGSDTSELGMPLTVRSNDSYYLASDNVSKWHCVWYSNPASPTFTSANILNTLSVGTTLTVTGASNLNGGVAVTGTSTLNGPVVLTNAGPSVTFNAGGPAIAVPSANTLTVSNGTGEVFRADSSGHLLVGTTTDDGSNLSVSTDVSSQQGKFTSTRFSNGGALVLRSAAGTFAAATALTSGSQSGTVTFRSYDGANYQDNASVDSWLEATTTSTSSPANLRFYTTPTGAITKSERMRITAAGQVLVAQTSNDGVSSLQVGGATVINGTLSVGGNITSTVGKITASNAVGALTASNGGGTGQTSIELIRTGAGVDQKTWEEVHDASGNYILRSVNDAYSAQQTAIQVSRTATSYTLGYMQIMPGGGHVVVGSSTDNGVDELQVTGTVQSTGGFRFPDGTLQTTANGVTAPISTVYTPAAAATFITTAGYSVGFAQVFKNNLRLIPNVDFTATDGSTVQLTTAATGRDRYEVLTGVIYSPSTVFQPTSAVFNVTAGQSLITTNYSVGCVWVFQNNDKLVPADFTATNGTTITLTNASTSSTDQYEVVSFTPFAVNGMLPLTGGTMSGALIVNSTITQTGNYTTSGTVTSSSTVTNGAAGTTRINTYETAGVARWVEGVDGSAESGFQAGSNWELTRYSDAGVAIDSPLYVYRNTGIVGLSQGLAMPDGYVIQNTPSGRNKIINGDCRIAQRTANGVYATTVSGYGGPDRFWAANLGGGGQFTQSLGTMVIGGVTRDCITQTVNTGWSTFTAGNYWSGVSQRIEGLNAIDLLGSPAVLSFWFKSNVTGTFSICLQDSTQANSYVSTFNATAGTPTKVVIPIASLPTNLVVPSTTGNGLFVWIGFLNQSTYVTATTNAWQTGNYLTTAACTNWAATAANYISMTDIQLETGLNVTPFDRLSLGLMMSLCRRYYYQITVPSGQAQSLVLAGLVNSATSAVFSMVLPTNMRVPPTLLSNNLWVTSAAAQYVGTSTSLVGSTTNDSIGFQIGASGASFTTGQAAGLYIGASTGTAGGSLILNSEI